MNIQLAMTLLTLSYSKYINKQIEPIQNILELPQHILSYCCNYLCRIARLCCNYLATKDLLLSDCCNYLCRIARLCCNYLADLCCKELYRIASLPSSFHGKFIFGSAIHSEYDKRINDGTNNDDINVLDRFNHLHEIHFINIFNYDTLQFLKTCNFPKIESIYLYDRFDFLIEYLPSLIPNISKLYIFTNGSNETLDIIEPNTNYYNE